MTFSHCSTICDACLLSIRLVSLEAIFESSSEITVYSYALLMCNLYVCLFICSWITVGQFLSKNSSLWSLYLNA